MQTLLTRPRLGRGGITQIPVSEIEPNPNQPRRVFDEEALQAFYALSRNEGILPALESSHALAHAMKLAPTMDKDAIILVNLSGRGDKDVAQVADLVNSGAFVPVGD